MTKYILVLVDIGSEIRSCTISGYWIWVKKSQYRTSVLDIMWRRGSRRFIQIHVEAETHTPICRCLWASSIVQDKTSSVISWIQPESRM